MAYGSVAADQITTSVAGSSLGAGNASIMKNRIINGSCVIDQRNAGASANVSGSVLYTLDRWNTYFPTGTSNTIQQVSDAPAGFVNSVKFTTGTGASIGSTSQNEIFQTIEGYNIADLGWGTANAKTVTLSFWVKSSLTGTFSIAIQGPVGAGRAYVSPYTINSANTWEQKTITIVGDTSGTWNTNNSAGMLVLFALGQGSNFITTANTWTTGDYKAVSGTTPVVSTSGATWQVTGVQLEVGSSATGYEYRQYGQELALCQRYYVKTFSTSVAPAQAIPDVTGAICGCVRAFGGASGSSWEPQGQWAFPVEMRANPSVTLYATYAGSGQWSNSGSTTSANARVQNAGTRNATFDNTGNTVAFGSNSPFIHATASAEL